MKNRSRLAKTNIAGIRVGIIYGIKQCAPKLSLDSRGGNPNLNIRKR